MLALGNEALMLTLLVGQLFKKLFFGRLREAEVEHLYERSWCVPARARAAGTGLAVARTAPLLAAAAGMQ